MKRKFDPNSEDLKLQETETYISYVKHNQSVHLFRNWIKYRKRLIDNPCDEKSHVAYSLAKLVDKGNPLPLMMPGVHFSDTYCSTHYESWEELYLKDDVFISQGYMHESKLLAFSLETVFLSNKYNGFLRGELHYDDKELSVMSPEDQKRFLAQLQERYPSYYSDYMNTRTPPPEISLQEMDQNKINNMLNAVEIMLVLSCHKGGLKNTTLPDSVTDHLSAYGYQFLLHTFSENFNAPEQEKLKRLWVKNINNHSEKTIEDLIDSAISGACTTTLGLYWLGLIKESRKNFSYVIDEMILNKIYVNFNENNPVESAKISKTLFMSCVKENIRYIATEMMQPREEHRFANQRHF